MKRMWSEEELKEMIEQGGGGGEKVTASDIDSGEATAGQVMKADGNGGAEWGDAGGEKLYEHLVTFSISKANYNTGYVCCKIILNTSNEISSIASLVNALVSMKGSSLNANARIEVNGNISSSDNSKVSIITCIRNNYFMGYEVSVVNGALSVSSLSYMNDLSVSVSWDEVIPL